MGRGRRRDAARRGIVFVVLIGNGGVSVGERGESPASIDRILYSDVVARIVPFTEARARLTELLDDVERRHEHVVITRNGRPVAIVVSPEEWEALEETLEVLQDEELLAALRDSEKDVEAGRLFSLDEVKRELGLA